MEFPYNRIVVVGTTSSGKSTLAEQLARKLDLDFIELDALYWERNWVEAPIDVFIQRVTNAIRSEGWIVAGNYHIVRDLIWPRAQAVIWLDYSFPVVFWRLTYRTLKRAITRELLWGKNIERFWNHFKIWSDESLFGWLFKTYWRRRREYSLLFAEPRHAHLTVIRLRSPREADDWLASL